jgi:hypothetical protein
MKWPLQLQGFAPEVLEVVSKQPAYCGGLNRPRLQNRYLDFEVTEQLCSLIG